LEQLNDLLNLDSSTPTQIRFVDIAGLVKGASDGEGLGNTFLGHIREIDALVHVVRCFDDGQVAHVEADLNPVRDVETVETELLLSDLAVADEASDRLGKRLKADPRGPEKDVHVILRQIVAALGRGEPVRSLDLDASQQGMIRDFGFLTNKPVLYVGNQNESADPVLGGVEVGRLRDRFGDDAVLPISAGIESEIVQLPVEERRSFAAEMGLEQTGLQRLIVSGYRLLSLITFYTIANRKLRAWQLRHGTTAPVAAGAIHSDMESGFIRAEAADAEALILAGGFDRLRESGKVRTEGRGYVVQDGDVIQFLFKA